MFCKCSDMIFRLILGLQRRVAERALDRRIRRRGWTGVYIGDYGAAPAWAYTLGFEETLDHPEILVFDVPPASAANLFDRVFRELRAGELIIEDGLRWPAEEPDAGVWRKVHPGYLGEWCTLACLRRLRMTGKRYGLEAFQYVLGDAAHRMPWEPGYDERLRPLQPALYRPPEAAVTPVAADGAL